MPNEIDKINDGSHNSPFERIKRVTDAGNEFWNSRDMAKILEYGDYRNFESVVRKARIACFNSGNRVEDHFVDVTDMIQIGKGGRREVDSILLSRYACYLIIQNADPRKDIVAIGQTYFAIQTRRQELADQQIEEERRLILRNEIKTHNTKLAEAAKGAGVIEPVDYAIFQNHGYKGLYGGLTAEGIHVRKGLKKSQKILDHMGSTEFAANLFRATQTEEKLKREGTEGKLQAQAITAPDPISQRVVVGCALGGDTAEIVLLDPPPGDTEKAEPTNLTADLVRKAAMKMRIPPAPLIKGGGERSEPGGLTETIFRGPDSATGTPREIALTHDDYKDDKRHGWLEIR